MLDFIEMERDNVNKWPKTIQKRIETIVLFWNYFTLTYFNCFNYNTFNLKNRVHVLELKTATLIYCIISFQKDLLYIKF